MRRKRYFFLLAFFLVSCWVSASCQDQDPSCEVDDDCDGGRFA